MDKLLVSPYRGTFRLYISKKYLTMIGVIEPYTLCTIDIHDFGGKKALVITSTGQKGLPHGRKTITKQAPTTTSKTEEVIPETTAEVSFPEEEIIPEATAEVASEPEEEKETPTNPTNKTKNLNEFLD